MKFSEETKEIVARLRAVGADLRAVGYWNENEGVDMFAGFEVIDATTKERLHPTRKATMYQARDILHRLETPQTEPAEKAGT